MTSCLPERGHFGVSKRKMFSTHQLHCYYATTGTYLSSPEMGPRVTASSKGEVGSFGDGDAFGDLSSKTPNTQSSAWLPLPMVMPTGWSPLTGTSSVSETHPAGGSLGSVGVSAEDVIGIVSAASAV
jgi:hypothetical protein